MKGEKERVREITRVNGFQCSHIAISSAYSCIRAESSPLRRQTSNRSREKSKEASEVEQCVSFARQSSCANVGPRATLFCSLRLVIVPMSAAQQDLREKSE